MVKNSDDDELEVDEVTTDEDEIVFSSYDIASYPSDLTVSVV